MFWGDLGCLKMKTKCPKCFGIPEMLDVRLYCERTWGQPRLADIFYREFMEYFGADGEGVNIKRINWVAAFKRWIRMASPMGDYYSARAWEMKLERCKPVRTRPAETYHPDKIETVPSVPMVSDIARSALSNLRGSLT